MNNTEYTSLTLSSPHAAIVYSIAIVGIVILGITAMKNGYTLNLGNTLSITPINPNSLSTQ